MTEETETERFSIEKQWQANKNIFITRRSVVISIFVIRYSYYSFQLFITFIHLTYVQCSNMTRDESLFGCTLLFHRSVKLERQIFYFELTITKRMSVFSVYFTIVYSSALYALHSRTYSVSNESKTSSHSQNYKDVSYISIQFEAHFHSMN